MKRTIIIFLFSLIVSNTIFSQNHSSYLNNINRANPREFLNEVYELRKNKQYDSIVSLIKHKIEHDTISKPYYYHQLACFYALKKDYKKASEQLFIALDSGIQINDVLTDTDVELLQNQSEWKSIKDTITSIYLRNNPNITDTSLSLKLWKIGIEDQRYRTLMRNNKRYDLKENTNEFDSISELYSIKIKNNLSFIKKLVKNKKWPLFSTVGKEAGEAAFLVVQHSGSNNLTKRALKLIENAVKKNEVSKSSYAMMIDRYLMNKNKKQIYGTQLRGRSKGMDEKGKVIYGRYFHYPIEDEKNVNKRREEMGMPTIEEYAKRFDVKYQYHPEYENMSCKKLYKYLIVESLK